MAISILKNNGLSEAAWAPAGLTYARRGRQTRIWTAPRFCKPDGKLWRPIEQVVRCRRNALTGGYRIEMGDSWIEFTPAASLQSSLLAASARYRITHRGFGEIVNPVLVPKQIDYRVRTHGKVSAVKNGWEFDGDFGIPLGVFMQSWNRRFPGRVVVKSDRVTLDLKDMEPDKKGEFNLDPTYYAEDYPVSGFITSLDFDSWAECRGGVGDIIR